MAAKEIPPWAYYYFYQWFHGVGEESKDDEKETVKFQVLPSEEERFPELKTGENVFLVLSRKNQMILDCTTKKEEAQVFICHFCGESSKPGETPVKVVLETRVKKYRNLNAEKEAKETQGREIVKEVLSCQGCRKE